MNGKLSKAEKSTHIKKAELIIVGHRLIEKHPTNINNHKDDNADSPLVKKYNNELYEMFYVNKLDDLMKFTNSLKATELTHK